LTFELAARIADAVLFEGYVLYPYRASSAKNRYRFTFGVLAPRVWSEQGGCDPWWLETQLLVRGAKPRVSARLRFMCVVARRIERFDGEGFEPVSELVVSGRTLLPWEEGEVRAIDFDASRPRVEPFATSSEESVELVHDEHGVVRGRVVRTRAALSGSIRVAHQLIASADARTPALRLAIRVENVTAGATVGAPRPAIMPLSMASTHVLLSVRDGSFVSILDPPAELRDAAQACVSQGCYPVLAGEEGTTDLALASPIILYDHPKIAPESNGDFFDAAEIDELLALRTQTLLPEEKAAARATDPRAAAILDRVEAMTDVDLLRLHGTRRDVPQSD
jgi:hypothetical protein